MTVQEDIMAQNGAAAIADDMEMLRAAAELTRDINTARPEFTGPTC